MSFQIETFGKWILAGEHSVLRGSPALVFPLKSKKLTLTYGEGPGEKPEYRGEQGTEYEFLFRAVFEKCCELLNLNSQDILKKQIIITSSLPVGTGLGASAAFCVAMTKMFQQLGYVAEKDVYDFALKLENLFHGESSGVDIAVCLFQKGLIFEREKRREILYPTWKPHLYVSYAGQRGMTFDCVKKVKHLIEVQPEIGLAVDEKMKQAVKICHLALTSEMMGSDRLEQLSSGIRTASECFDAWELTGGGVRSEMDRLLHAGALAVKPTGSGGGGYVLSLWGKPPVSVSGLSFCFD